MAFLRAHLVATAVILVAVLALGGVFVFAQPKPSTPTILNKPGDGLHYTHIAYSLQDASKAFAQVGVQLVQGGHSPGISDLRTKDKNLEISIFGDRKVVDATGFSDYYTLTSKGWALAPKTCTKGARNAELWRQNLRVIVMCNADATTRLAQATRALDTLPFR